MNNHVKKLLPIGISDFKEIIDENCLYVDKTLFIQEVVEQSARVALILRPRRFGKTLNLSMLRYFFEKVDEDRSYLFKDLNIWKNEKYRMLQGKFPVIFLTLKSIKFSSWNETYDAFRRIISEEFERHRYILENDTLTKQEKETYHEIIYRKDDTTLIGHSLFLLTKWLHRYYKQKVIVLLDEYGTQAHAAYVGKYYDTFIDFI